MYLETSICEYLREEEFDASFRRVLSLRQVIRNTMPSFGGSLPAKSNNAWCPIGVFSSKSKKIKKVRSHKRVHRTSELS